MLTYLKRRWGSGGNIPEHEQGLELTVTKLMVSMMKMDDKVDQRERYEIIRLVGKRFAISREAAEDLLQEVTQTEGDAPRFKQLAQQIKANYCRHEIAELLGEIWAVAEADGHVDFYEERYISRISSLLGISSKELSAAKLHCKAV